MQTMTVTTGYGYIKDAGGRIVDKVDLPIGDHPLKDGFTYTEVADQTALAAVAIWQDPSAAATQVNERKISDKIRADAISALIATGNLPAGYK